MVPLPGYEAGSALPAAPCRLLKEFGTPVASYCPTFGRGEATHEALRSHRKAARHQTREGLELDVHLRADRRYVAGDDHRRDPRPPEADETAGLRRCEVVRLEQIRGGAAQ